MSEHLNFPAMPDFGEGRQSITIADVRQPEMPLVYVSPGFERFSGYTRQEVLGRSCRFLQGVKRDQPGVQLIRDAIRAGQPCIVDLINFKKCGSPFNNRLSLQPVTDSAGALAFYIGLQSDVSSLFTMRSRMEDYLRGLGLHLA